MMYQLYQIKLHLVLNYKQPLGDCFRKILNFRDGIFYLNKFRNYALLKLRFSYFLDCKVKKTKKRKIYSTDTFIFPLSKGVCAVFQKS